MKQRLVFIAATCAAMPPIVSAQEMTLDPVVVTASRTAQTADEALASVTVITREDLERKQAQSVLEALRGTSSINIVNQGGAGKLSSVFMRGTESDHTLVLVDGIRIGDVASGMTAWQDIPIEQIERIEIVRGPRSSLYGSDAIGGVIHIFTRKGDSGPWLHGSAGFGSNSTYKGQVGFSGGDKRSWFSLNTSHTDTDGFNACRGNLNAGCGAIEPDDDGYRNSSLQARVGRRMGNTAEIEFSLLHAQGHTEFDGNAPYRNENDFVERVVSTHFAISPLENWRTSFSAGNAYGEREYYRNGTHLPSSDIETTRSTFSWQNDVSLGDHHLMTAGLDFQLDEADAATPFTIDERDNTGVFLQYQGDLRNHQVQLALRHDDNEQYGGHSTGSIAWGHDWDKSFGAFASYGTAFKAPTFQDLHLPWGGNLELEPEESRSLELGLQGLAGTATWSLSLFQTDIDELIASDSLTWTVYNIDQARIRGLEATIAIDLLGWSTRFGVSVLDPEDRSDGYRGNQLVRRARRQANLDLDRKFGRFSLGGTFYAESRRYDDPDNTVSLGGYALLDLRAGYALSKDWRLQAKIDNVLDKDYETSAYYNQPGRTYFVTLRYAPQR